MTDDAPARDTDPPRPRTRHPARLLRSLAPGAGEAPGHWVKRLRRQALPYLQGETLMMSLAVAVGLLTGLLASALIGLIALVQQVAFGTRASWLLLLVVPTVGALVVGVLVTYVPESSGSGVVQVMSAIALHGGRSSARVPFAGIVASGVALGTAAVFGLAFLRGVDIAGRVFGRLQAWPPLKLALGGLGVGVIALVVPEADGYNLVLPLMLAAGLATFIADRIQRESVYTWPLRKRGIVYAEPDDVDLMQTVRVGEIMTVEPDTLPADTTLQQARAELARTGHHSFPVLANDKLIGVCTLRDLARSGPGADVDGHATRTVGDVCTRDVLTVTPDDPVYLALRRMATIDVGRLPVVAAHDHQHLVGLIRRSDLVTAYRHALTRSLASQQRAELRRLRDLAGTNLIEVPVAEHSDAAGRRVRDIDWPQHALLTSIHRAGDLIMPHGDTELHVGDTVSVIVDDDHVATVRALLSGTGALRADGNV